jgi:hypothetical protein
VGRLAGHACLISVSLHLLMSTGLVRYNAVMLSQRCTRAEYKEGVAFLVRDEQLCCTTCAALRVWVRVGPCIAGKGSNTNLRGGGGRRKCSNAYPRVRFMLSGSRKPADPSLPRYPPPLV